MQLERALVLATALAAAAPVFGEPRPRGSGPSPFDLAAHPVAATVREELATNAPDVSNLLFRSGGLLALVDESAPVVIDNLGLPAGLTRPAGLVAIAAEDEEEAGVESLKAAVVRPNLQLMVVEDAMSPRVIPVSKAGTTVTPGRTASAPGGANQANQQEGGERK